MILGTASWWHLDVDVNVSVHGVCLSSKDVSSGVLTVLKDDVGGFAIIVR